MHFQLTAADVLDTIFFRKYLRRHKTLLHSLKRHLIILKNQESYIECFYCQMRVHVKYTQF